MADWRRRFNSFSKMWQMSANRWQLAVFLVALPRRFHFWGEWITSFSTGNIRYHLRRQDWLAFREIMLHGEYDFIAPLLAQADNPVVIDLGANVGLFSALVLGMRPETAVYSVEPMPATHQLLQRNQRENPQVHWQTYQLAIWETDGEVALQNDTPLSTSVYVGETGNIIVPAMRLDSFWRQLVNQPVTLLKMDIEGAEEGALRGQEAVLAQVENLVVEIHPNRCDAQAILSLLYQCYPAVYRVTGRLSGKPLLLATRKIIDDTLFTEVSPDEFDQ